MAGKPGVDDIRKWGHELDRLSDRIGPRFVRTEIRRRARVYLEVLLSNVPRKNGWQLAEHAGDATPKNIQLFNLKNDVTESTDLSKKHPELVEELMQEVKNLENSLK